MSHVWLYQKSVPGDDGNSATDELGQHLHLLPSVAEAQAHACKVLRPRRPMYPSMPYLIVPDGFYVVDYAV